MYSKIYPTRMKYFIVSLFLLLQMANGFSQSDDNPVVWSHEVKTLSDTEYEISITGEIFTGWHVYSQYTAEGGSLPSVFNFKKAGEDYQLLGETQESGAITEYSDIFEIDETFFKEKAIFTQRIQLLNKAVDIITVEL